MLLLIAMMLARAEHADLLLCGRGALKTAVIKAEDGILKTAIKLQAQVQVSHPPQPCKNNEWTQAWEQPAESGKAWIDTALKISQAD